MPRKVEPWHNRQPILPPVLIWLHRGFSLSCGRPPFGHTRVRRSSRPSLPLQPGGSQPAEPRRPLLPRFPPPQQNLWVDFGSGKFPITRNTVNSMPCGVLKPYAFLVVSFALPLNHSTTPDEITASNSEPVEDQMRDVLWRHDFILSKKCKLETRTHMGKLAPTWENLRLEGAFSLARAWTAGP